MSQAETLLNNVSEEVPVHNHPVPDTDTYFVIDPITRQIENTNRKKTVIMQYDHNSERFTFEIPRYVDGHDMLECTSVTVNVDNIEDIDSDDETVVEPRIYSDAPDMSDLRVHPANPEKVISSWLISRNSTQLAGTLSFHIEYKCVDINGNVVYEWSTDTYNGITVKARKKNGEAAVLEHTDLLEQWRTRIFGAADSVMADIEAEGKTQVAAVKAESVTQQEAVELKGTRTLETIPEDYTEVDAMADEAVRTKSNAIVCEASGETMIVNDSSNDYVRGLKLFGKSSQVKTNGYQLFDASVLGTVSKGGATITNNPDGSFTVSGSGTLTESIAMFKDYTHEESLRMLKLGILHCPLTQTMPYCYVQIRNSSEIYFGITHSRPSYEITQAILDDDDMRIRIGFYGGPGEEIIPGTIKPMLYQDGDGTWEPYSGGYVSPSPEWPQEIISVESPTAVIHGKNLLNSNYASDYMTHNGVTYSDAGDGRLAVNGTASANTSFAFASFAAGKRTFIPAGTYTVSGNPSNDIYFGFYLYDSQETEEYSLAVSRIKGGIPWTFTIEKDSYYGTYVHVPSGNTVATVISPQLEIGREATEYEPPCAHQKIKLNRILHAIPVTSGGNHTDSDGQQWICDEIDLERGVYVQRVFRYTVPTQEAADLERQTNYDGDGYYGWFVRDDKIKDFGNSRNDNPGYSTHFIVTNHSNPSAANQFRIWGAVGCLYFTLNTDNAEDAANIINSAAFYMALENPIETPLTAEEITAFKALHTNYPNTTILNDAGAWMSVKYNADTKTYIENPKVLKLTDSSTGVVYELKIVDGNLIVTPI